MVPEMDNLIPYIGLGCLLITAICWLLHVVVTVSCQLQSKPEICFLCQSGVVDLRLLCRKAMKDHFIALTLWITTLTLYIYICILVI